MSHIKNYFLNLNLFTSDADNTKKDDDHQHRSNVIATRVYLVLMILALIMVALVSWLSQRTTTVKVQHPMKDQLNYFPLDARLHIRIRQIRTLINKAIFELNIFENRSNNEHHLRYQRIATRLYIFFLVISILIITVYSSSAKHIFRETVHNPTESQYIQLQQIYPNSISCPCTSISTSYSTFITIQPYYHQICTSDFVTQRWIDYIEIHLDQFYPIFDYRVNAVTQFKLLATVCQQAKKTVVNAVETFLKMEFVESQVVPQMIFESEMNSRIESWKMTTINNFLRTIQLVQATDRGNHLMNGNFDVFFQIDNASHITTIKPMDYDNCSCDLSQSCHIPMKIYFIDINLEIFDEIFNVSNFFVGCFPVEALLASTLECFYDESCMRQIDWYMPVSLNKSFSFSALDPSRNLPNETIESIVSRLMVDFWSSNISFASYYDACSALSCTFQYERRNDLFNVFTTIIGVLGGLSLAFKLLSLITLQFIEKIENGLFRSSLIPSIKSWFFHSDEHQIRNKLHVMLVLVTLCIFCSFSAFTPQSVTGTIEKPSFSVYQDLAQRFSDSLQCPCSDVSIEYESFLTIVPHFHHICSSNFVLFEWINYLYDQENVSYGFSVNDNRSSTIGQFQLLSSFCKLSREAVNDSLSQLATNNFISAYVLLSNKFEQHMQMLINQFQETIPNEFLTILSLIREMTGANMIMSALSTSWAFSTPSDIDFLQTTHTEPKIYGECNCGLSSKCVEPSKRIMIGCYPLEALLQSTLTCFYDQQCIDPTNTFKAINISSLKSSHFSPNATAELIVSKLMVEDYTSNISYEDYFTQCAPVSCSYSYIEYSNIIEAISNVVELYGGLVIICRSIATIIVVIFQGRLRKVTPATRDRLIINKGFLQNASSELIFSK
ncbi:unnamed protein product [Rotaria sp. Silwood2]|nr:unnamed protein product [Rotaria sp. Silwood2]